MARAVNRAKLSVIEREPPAMSVEDREDQLYALAFDLAEERLRDKSASNQLIAEIILSGTSKARLEKEKLRRENEVLRVKAEAMESQKHSDEMYVKAIKAMRSYAGLEEFDDDDYEDD